MSNYTRAMARWRMKDMADQIVRVDLTKPVYRMSPADRKTLDDDDDKASAQISVGLLRSAVQLKWPQGMDGKDGKVWGRVLDQLAEEPIALEVRRSDFDWLYKVFTDDSLKFMPAVQNWRAALESYLDELKLAMKVEEKKTDEKSESKDESKE